MSSSTDVDNKKKDTLNMARPTLIDLNPYEYNQK